MGGCIAAIEVLYMLKYFMSRGQLEIAFWQRRGGRPPGSPFAGVLQPAPWPGNAHPGEVKSRLTLHKSPFQEVEQMPGREVLHLAVSSQQSGQGAGPIGPVQPNNEAMWTGLMPPP